MIFMIKRELYLSKIRKFIDKEEIKYKDKYDYVVINNTVDEAVLEIENIINNC